MSKIDTGGSASPTYRPSGLPGGDRLLEQPGMTLLDYFAGQAAANPTIANVTDYSETTCARFCYEYAQKMIAEKRRLESEGKK